VTVKFYIQRSFFLFSVALLAGCATHSANSTRTENALAARTSNGAFSLAALPGETSELDKLAILWRLDF
jgi:hypothetical protein